MALVLLLIIPASPSFAQDVGKYTTATTINIVPSSGPPGDTFYVYVTGLESGSIVVAQSPWGSDKKTVGDSEAAKLTLTVSEDAAPGQYTIKVNGVRAIIYSSVTLQGTFTVTKKTVTESNTVNGYTGTQPPNPPPPPPNGTNNGKSATAGTGTTNTAGSNSNGGSQPPPPPPPPPPKPTSVPASQTIYKGDSDTGAKFYAEKTVEGGDASPSDFDFQVILTGPSGTATYQLNLGARNSYSAESSFSLNLPQGNTLDAGNYQIVETNPMGYTPVYDKGCSGSYDNNGYEYFCHVTNVKKVTTNTIPAVTRTGPLPPTPSVTGKTHSTTSSNTGKISIPTSNTGKTLPTIPGKVATPTIGKNPTPSTGKVTLPTTSKTVTSCPQGTILVNGQCVVKGKVVGATQ